MHVAALSAHRTESAAREAVAALPAYKPSEYRGIWRIPAPYGALVHLFSDEATEALNAGGWTLVSSALPGDADASFLLDREPEPCPGGYVCSGCGGWDNHWHGGEQACRRCVCSGHEPTDNATSPSSEVGCG